MGEVYKDNNLFFTDITYADGQFLAVGNKPNKGYIFISSDGEAWTYSDLGSIWVNSVSGY